MKRLHCVILLLSFLVSDIGVCQSWIDPQRIEIVRDTFGVPHIFAPTDAEVAYGLAWATAEDDPELQQILLLAAKGMLGRYKGKEGAIIDYAAKLLRVQETAARLYESDISPEFRKVLEGYAAGVNAYYSTHKKDRLVKKAFPVTGKDIIAGYMLGQSLMSGIDGVLKKIVQKRALEKIDLPDTSARGSNAFAFNSKITTDGNTYLAVNSHQPLEGLLSWYEIHLCSEEGWNILGGTFHGGVTVFHGTNEHLGWAHTVNGFDRIDVFQLEMHPEEKNRYRIDDQWYTLKEERVKLVVGLGKRGKLRIPVKRKIWLSEYGPTLVTDEGAFAIRHGAVMSVKAAEQWYRMNKARNFHQFYKAVSMLGLAMMNIVYADKYDTTFMISTGLYPQRKPGYDWKNVVPGNTRETLWTTFHPVEDLPQWLNPPTGYLFNVNNTPFSATDPKYRLNPDDFPAEMGIKTAENNRSQRIYELMDSIERVDWETFWYIKFNKQMPDSLIFHQPWFNINLLMEMNPGEYPEIADALSRIQQWNRKCTLENKNYPITVETFYILNDKISDRNRIQYDTPEKQKALLAECVAEAKAHLLKHFGTLDIPLKNYQRHIRGDVDLPVEGGPTAIKAAFGKRLPDGRRKIWVGDSYIQMVKFTREGPQIFTVAPYGASNRPDSPHYTDQMKRYVGEHLKPMSLKKEDVYRAARCVYHPVGNRLWYEQPETVNPGYREVPDLP